MPLYDSNSRKTLGRQRVAALLSCYLDRYWWTVRLAATRTLNIPPLSIFTFLRFPSLPFSFLLPGLFMINTVTVPRLVCPRGMVWAGMQEAGFARSYTTWHALVAGNCSSNGIRRCARNRELAYGRRLQNCSIVAQIDIWNKVPMYKARAYCPYWPPVFRQISHCFPEFSSEHHIRPEMQ